MTLSQVLTIGRAYLRLETHQRIALQDFAERGRAPLLHEKATVAILHSDFLTVVDVMARDSDDDELSEDVEHVRDVMNVRKVLAEQ